MAAGVFSMPGQWLRKTNKGVSAHVKCASVEVRQADTVKVCSPVVQSIGTAVKFFG